MPNDQILKTIEQIRKRLKKKMAENKLGDISYSYSEEEKKELIENAKLAQLNWERVE